jgi:hypothetical protein
MADRFSAGSRPIFPNYKPGFPAILVEAKLPPPNNTKVDYTNNFKREGKNYYMTGTIFFGLPHRILEISPYRMS